MTASISLVNEENEVLKGDTVDTDQSYRIMVERKVRQAQNTKVHISPVFAGSTPH